MRVKEVARTASTAWTDASQEVCCLSSRFHTLKVSSMFFLPLELPLSSMMLASGLQNLSQIEITNDGSTNAVIDIFAYEPSSSDLAMPHLASIVSPLRFVSLFFAISMEFLQIRSPDLDDGVQPEHSTRPPHRRS